jgi:HSP20 family molecular chaperone IbpA
LKNGILEIDIKRELPEPKKHVAIQIRNGWDSINWVAQ